MKIKLKIEKEFEVKYLQAKCGARYWEDSRINGVEDTEEGENIPCKEGDYWCPLIELETGKILNWEIGKTAEIYYKCCDDGFYSLLDEEKTIVKQVEGYVPEIMCPVENGYGDYVIMNIDENGQIQNWNPDFSYFED